MSASSDQVEPVDQGDAVTLTLKEADDLSESAEKPRKRKLKDSLEMLFVTEDDEKPKKKRKRKSTFFQNQVTTITGGCMFLAALIAPDDWSQPFYDGATPYTLLPTDKQWEAMLSPLARILDRHSNIAELNPDVLDALASLNAVVAYSFELRSVLMLKRYIEQEKQKEEQTRRNAYPFTQMIGA